MPLSCDDLTIGEIYSTFSMEFALVELSLVDFAVVPFECSFAFHQAILECAFVDTGLCFHTTVADD